MKVPVGDGKHWRVGRRLRPWRRAVRVPSVPDLGTTTLGDDPVSAVIGLLAVIILLPVLIIAAIALAELLVLLLLIPLFLLGRVLLQRPFTIEIEAPDGSVQTESVSGWRASGHRVKEIAGELAAGAAHPSTAAGVQTPIVEVRPPSGRSRHHR